MRKSKVLLYVETNFLISIAKGQDPEADGLLQNTPPSARLAIPNICCVEALSKWGLEQKYSKSFSQQVKLRLNEARRDLTSPNASPLIGYLEGADTKTEDILNDTQARLKQAIDLLIDRVEIIPLSTEIIEEISAIALIRPKTYLIKNDLMDNLILHCILEHAGNHPGETKVFLSGNTNDFGTAAVQEALRGAGVEHYFSRSENFLGWLSSQSGG